MSEPLTVALIQVAPLVGLSILTQWLYSKWRTRRSAKVDIMRCAHDHLIHALENVDDMNAVLIIWTEREYPERFHLHSNANVEQFVDSLANMRVNGMLRRK